MKQQPVKYRALGISGLVSGLILLGSFLAFDTVTPSILGNKLIFPLTRLLFFILIGLVAGQAIESLGWTRQFAVLARPFFSFSNMGNHCSAAFTTAFISGAAANAMLLEYYEDKKISKTQLFLANYLNHFPAFFLHLPTTMFIVLPLTGWAGAIYFLLTFLATLLRTILCLCFGRVALPVVSHETNHRITRPADRPSLPEVARRIRKRLPGRMVNILIWVVPIYTLVFVLHINGYFDALNMALSRTISLELIPVESLSVVILSFAAEFTSGFAAAGALMNAGVITVKQTVMALLLGNILAFPIRAMRHQLPRYIGIFSPKLGLQLLLSGQAFRVVSLMFIGWVYLMVA